MDRMRVVRMGLGAMVMLRLEVVVLGGGLGKVVGRGSGRRQRCLGRLPAHRRRRRRRLGRQLLLMEGQLLLGRRLDLKGPSRLK